MASSDPRHAAIRAHILQAYENINGLPAIWSPKHAGILATFLKSCSWTVEILTACIDNRFQSEGINECEDPARWIHRLPNYAKGPLDQYGRPLYVAKNDALEEWGKGVQERARKALEATRTQ